MKRTPPSRPVVLYPWKRRRAEQALKRRVDARTHAGLLAYMQKYTQRMELLASAHRELRTLLDQDSQPSSHLFPDIAEVDRAYGAVKMSKLRKPTDL